MRIKEIAKNIAENFIRNQAALISLSKINYTSFDHELNEVYFETNNGEKHYVMPCYLVDLMEIADEIGQGKLFFSIEDITQDILEEYIHRNLYLIKQIN